MPHIAVKLAPGRSEVQKQELAARIMQDVIAILHVDEDSISLTVEEVDPKYWTEQVYQPDIQAKWDKLYKKPGYEPIAN
jgi:4-oxalocrotonate tautomerase